MGSQADLSGPDLKAGIDETELGQAPIVGHVDGEAVLLVRHGAAIRAVGATCTHYGGPLGEGIIVNGEVRCPWHHACFDLETGTPHGPAINPLPCWDVDASGGRIRVGAKREIRKPKSDRPERVVIIGGGAAGIACAEALRDEGHRGGIVIASAEGTDPVDRPNLSKDLLAGTAPEEWAFIRSADALRDRSITVVEPVTEINLGARTVVAGGRVLPYDALLFATGAEPMRLPLPGADQPHVHTLRTLSDMRGIVAGGIAAGTPVVVIGSSFIGLEAAASLKARGCDVTVVGPDAVPLARVLGDEVGAFVKTVHEGKGVKFRLGRKPASIGADSVTLDDGSTLPAKLVIMGVGVKPRTQLAEAAGLKVDRGIVVDAQLSAAPGVWAAGDVARYPYGGEQVRIEHWQVAVRHGQNVARAMLGLPTRFDVPFFWSQHHDVTLGYVGHAEKFDTPEVKGSLDARDAHVVYRSGGAVKAVVTIGRDKLALEVEAAMERADAKKIDELVS